MGLASAKKGTCGSATWSGWVVSRSASCLALQWSPLEGGVNGEPCHSLFTDGKNKTRPDNTWWQGYRPWVSLQACRQARRTSVCRGWTAVCSSPVVIYSTGSLQCVGPSRLGGLWGFVGWLSSRGLLKQSRTIDAAVPLKLRTKFCIHWKYIGAGT